MLVWVASGGIVGRGVLLDWYSWALSRGQTPKCFSTTRITLSELLEVAKAQNVTFQAGDILFVRTGFLKSFQEMSTPDSIAFAGEMPPNVIGVDACEEVLRWIWDTKFAAVAGDQPAFEALPFQSKDFWLHEWLLAGWGLPIGEFFDLEKLSGECAKYGKWTFFYSSMPLNVRFFPRYVITWC
jgi:hypothetical protein